jgi:MFS family permease
MFAASVSKEYYQFLLSQGLMFGIGLAFVYPPASTISRQYFGNRHGFANGIVVSGGALGGCILPYAVRKMITTYDLSSTFRILGYIAIGILVPSILLLQPKNKPESSSRSRPPLMDFSLLKDGRFLCLVVGCTIAMTGFLPRYFLLTTSAIVNGISPTYASWLLGMMNGLSILGRVGIGYFADKFGKVQALTASFILCGLGHFIFWLPGVSVTVDGTGVPTALFTLFVVYIGIFGSGFISLFAVVVSHLCGSENLASKTGLLSSAIGMTVLAGPSAVYAIIDTGVPKQWTIGVLTSGLFLFVGGLVLLVASVTMQKQKRRDATET